MSNLDDDLLPDDWEADALRDEKEALEEVWDDRETTDDSVKMYLHEAGKYPL
jgi:hypothetical protein